MKQGPLSVGRAAASRLAAVLLLGLCLPAPALQGSSVTDTVAKVIDRLQREWDGAKLRLLDGPQAEAFLTGRERETLATEHIVFRVDAPAVVSVIREAEGVREPFWLKERGFQPAAASFKVDDKSYAVWERSFPPGVVGLGVNSIEGGGSHYFVAVRAQRVEVPVRVSALRPKALRTATLTVGARPYVDRDETVGSAPAGYLGCVLVRTEHARRDDGRLLGRLRFTNFPSGKRPDNLVLTWRGDPRTSQSIQWRTSADTPRGVVEYRRASEPASPFQSVAADTRTLRAPEVVNDPAVCWHTARVTGLDPATAYVYRVGDGTPGGWSEPRLFTTAPGGPARFAFVYVGDAQVGLDQWGLLLSNTFRAQPDAAFVTIAGDLVNHGTQREEWDSLFRHAQGVCDRRPLMPAIGNHDCQGGNPRLYLDFFDLPRNGPVEAPLERAYWFEYGGALFVVLDSNLPAEEQARWLDRTLARSRARWKFVCFHHPVYSSALRRDNRKLRGLWMPLFDRYGVDLVLQGHDHAYLRTHPLRGGQRVAEGEGGTVYIVSMSGTKTYLQAPHSYTAVGFRNVPTAQTIDLDPHGSRLEYRAYDTTGRIRDQFTLRKSVVH